VTDQVKSTVKPAAVAALAQTFTFPLALAVLVLLFLLIQSRLDGRDPKLRYAPRAAGEARVRIRSSADIVAARQQGRELASLVGFSVSNLTLIATAISEVSRNIIEYAGEGEVTIRFIREGNRTGVKIVASDTGPGIADLKAVMRDGFSTGHGMGMGLPGARRLMDDFEISSAPGAGTTVTGRLPVRAREGAA